MGLGRPPGGTPPSPARPPGGGGAGTRRGGWRQIAGHLRAGQGESRAREAEGAGGEAQEAQEAERDRARHDARAVGRRSPRAGGGGARARGGARRARRRRAARASATATTAAPRALLLNDAGEEVDEEGNVLEPVARTGAGVRAVSTFKVNAKSSEEKQKLDKLEAFAALQRETAAEAATEDATWADPSVIGRRRRRKAEFQVRRPPRAVLSRTIFIASINVRVDVRVDR